jgi:hypothetical protein
MGMRIAILAFVLAAGCAPIPPGEELGGTAEWAFDGTTQTGPIWHCYVAEGGTVLGVTGGERGRSVTVVLLGDVTIPEREAEVDTAYRVRPGAIAGTLESARAVDCTAHVGTGAGTWIIDLECADGSASFVVTGCERR